ncbi:integrase catalytic domain-containing protein [Trichonephila clavata]|uniref:Integrase catalytic domain-containing protein n=1 Tax=Trichonephila clavata TaxID=2740835 RepID=A0A8X6ILW5_TRICU|nr:integrase catalytic domain-containing protein [Trichonephila clavata]
MSNKSYEDRKSEVIRRRCCLVCLKPGHMAKKCHSGVKCLICGRRPYVLLCPDLRKENPSPNDKGIYEEENPTEALLTNIPAEQEAVA